MLMHRYKHMYINKNGITWNIIVALTAVALTQAMIMINSDTFPDGFCVMDVSGLVIQGLVFPLILFVLVFSNLKLLEIDNTPMYMVKYKSKRYIWGMHCGLSFLYSFTNIAYVIAAVMLMIYLRGFSFMNWNKEGSFYYMLTFRYTKGIGQIHFNSISIILFCWISISLLSFFMCMFILLVENVSESRIIATLILVIVTGEELSIRLFYRHVLIHMEDWVNTGVCVRKILFLIIADTCLFLAGYIQVEARQLYGKGEEG